METIKPSFLILLGLNNEITKITITKMSANVISVAVIGCNKKTPLIIQLNRPFV